MVVANHFKHLTQISHNGDFPDGNRASAANETQTASKRTCLCAVHHHCSTLARCRRVTIWLHLVPCMTAETENPQICQQLISLLMAWGFCATKQQYKTICAVVSSPNAYVRHVCNCVPAAEGTRIPYLMHPTLYATPVCAQSRTTTYPLRGAGNALPERGCTSCDCRYTPSWSKGY